MCMYTLEHMDREVKKGSDLVGKTVLFTVKDAGRKSLEARNVVLADESVPLSVGWWSGIRLHGAGPDGSKDGVYQGGGSRERLWLEEKSDFISK